MERLGEKVDGQLQALHEKNAKDCLDARSDASQKFRDLGDTTTSKDDFAALCEKVKQMRPEIGEDYDTKFNNLYRVVAMQDCLDRDLLLQRDEREQMVHSFDAASTKMNEKNRQIEELFNEARKKIDDISGRAKDTFEQLHEHQKQLGKLGEIMTSTKESFVDEKARLTNVVNQQSHARSEIQFIIGKVQEVETITLDIKGLKSAQESQEVGLDKLRVEVSQWADAIAAQQELRKETVSLRVGIEDVRSRIDEYDKEQKLCIENVRELHSSWLGMSTTSS